jgi:hypothetical protein
VRQGKRLGSGSPVCQQSAKAPKSPSPESNRPPNATLAELNFLVRLEAFERSLLATYSSSSDPKPTREVGQSTVSRETEVLGQGVSAATGSAKGKDEKRHRLSRSTKASTNPTSPTLRHDSGNIEPLDWQSQTEVTTPSEDVTGVAVPLAIPPEPPVVADSSRLVLRQDLRHLMERGQSNGSSHLHGTAPRGWASAAERRWYDASPDSEGYLNWIASLQLDDSALFQHSPDAAALVDLYSDLIVGSVAEAAAVNECREKLGP